MKFKELDGVMLCDGRITVDLEEVGRGAAHSTPGYYHLDSYKKPVQRAILDRLYDKYGDCDILSIYFNGNRLVISLRG